MVCPLYRDCPLLRDSNCIILIGGLKFGYFVLSIVERYLIQCPLFGVSVKRDSTVVTKVVNINFNEVTVKSARSLDRTDSVYLRIDGTDCADENSIDAVCIFCSVVFALTKYLPFCQ